MYPQGASAQGVLNLSGSVWEWCANRYDKPRQEDQKGEVGRVVRGGSWNNNRDNARASYRNHNDPTNRNNSLGFEWCVSPTSHGASRPAFFDWGRTPTGVHRQCLSTTVGRSRRRVRAGAGTSRPHGAPAARRPSGAYRTETPSGRPPQGVSPFAHRLARQCSLRPPRGHAARRLTPLRRGSPAATSLRASVRSRRPSRSRGCTGRC